MQPILAVTVPFFALVLCGWLAARAGVLPDSAIPGLNAFVLYFALPCMLLRFGMSTPLFELLNPALLGVYLLCALMMVFTAIAFTLGARIHLKDAAFGALAAAQLHGSAGTGLRAARCRVPATSRSRPSVTAPTTAASHASS